MLAQLAFELNLCLHGNPWITIYGTFVLHNVMQTDGIMYMSLSSYLNYLLRQPTIYAYSAVCHALAIGLYTHTRIMLSHIPHTHTGSERLLATSMNGIQYTSLMIPDWVGYTQEAVATINGVYINVIKVVTPGCFACQVSIPVLLQCSTGSMQGIHECRVYFRICSRGLGQTHSSKFQEGKIRRGHLFLKFKNRCPLLICPLQMAFSIFNMGKAICKGWEGGGSIPRLAKAPPFNNSPPHAWHCMYVCIILRM